MVYIAEAHATDTWPLGNHVSLPSHKTFNDRVAASKLLTEKFGLNIPVLYDDVNNNFDTTYAVWPERYYLLSLDKIQYIGYPTTEFGFNRRVLKSVIKRAHENPTEDLGTVLWEDNYDFSYDICP